MRTKHLENLIADINVSLYTLEAKVLRDHGKCDLQDETDCNTVTRMWSLLTQLTQVVQVDNESFLLDHKWCDKRIAEINLRGYSFKLPECRGLLQLTIDVANIDYEDSRDYAQTFFLQMVRPGVTLSDKELAAAQAALDMLEGSLT